MVFLEVRSDGLELSLKLYHAGELQLGYQQLMTEAPRTAHGSQGGMGIMEAIPFLYHTE